MTVSPDAMQELVNFAITQPPKSLIGAVLKKHDNPDEIYLYGGGRINWKTATITFITREEDISQLDYLNGSCIFFHSSRLADLGLLPTGYFLYWEETDWCQRAKRAGYTLSVCLRAVCFDKISATIGKSYLSDFYYTRNGLRFIRKYGRNNLKYAVYATYLRILRRIFTGQIKRAQGSVAGLKEFLKMQENEVE
jgi:GT2 family glycosyltransferase